MPWDLSQTFSMMSVGLYEMGVLAFDEESTIPRAVVHQFLSELQMLSKLAIEGWERVSAEVTSSSANDAKGIRFRGMPFPTYTDAAIAELREARRAASRVEAELGQGNEIDANARRAMIQEDIHSKHWRDLLTLQAASTFEFRMATDRREFRKTAPAPADSPAVEPATTLSGDELVILRHVDTNPGQLQRQVVETSNVGRANDILASLGRNGLVKNTRATKRGQGMGGYHVTEAGKRSLLSENKRT